MQVWRSAADVPSDLAPTAVSLGNFDGVHRGHQALVRQLVDLATARGLLPVAVTFDPHPIAVLRPELAPVQITPLADRLELLGELGVAGVLVIRFTPDFAQQSPEEFVAGTFVETLHARAVVVGADSRFGVRNSGNVDTLRELGPRYGFEVVVLDDLGDGARWSSSMVRASLGDGDVARAAEVIGRPHRVTGEVVHGNHRGRDLGFPTANLGADSAGMIPAEGVYAGWLTRLGLSEGAADRRLPAAISVGTNPTFDTNDRRTVEAYVLDRTDLDLYGERVAVDFVEHLRPTLRFEGIEDLVTQMRADVARSRSILGHGAPTV